MLNDDNQVDQVTDTAPASASTVSSTPSPEIQALMDDGRPVKPTFGGASKKPKKRIILVCVLIALLIGGGLLYWFMLRDKGSQITPQQTNQQSQTSQQALAVLEEVEYSAAKYSANQNGNMYGLTVDDKIVLERSEPDWITTSRWNEWLFFASVDFKGKKWDDPEREKTTYSIHGYNFDTKKYVTLGTIEAVESNYLADTAVYDDHAYFYFGKYMGDTQTFRCKLDNAKACGSIELVYHGEGDVVARGSQYFLISSFGDAGVGRSTVSTFDLSTKKSKKLLTAESEFGVGKILVAIDDSSRVWVAEYTGDVEKIANNEGEAKFIKLYAVDLSGAVTKTYTAADLPLSGLRRLGGFYEQDGALSTNKVVLYSKDKKQSFDLKTETAGTVESVTEEDDETTSQDIKDSITKLLSVKEPYRLVTKDCLHDKKECQFKAE